MLLFSSPSSCFLWRSFLAIYANPEPKEASRRRQRLLQAKAERFTLLKNTMRKPDSSSSSETSTLRIGAGEVGQRLDRYPVSQSGDLSRTSFQQLIHE